MRKLFAAAGAVALALTMTACGSSGGSGDAGKASGDSGADGAKEVGVTTWWSAGSEKDGFEALSKVFKEQHPDITLKNLATSGGGGTNAKQKLAADLAAKNPPDTYQSHAGRNFQRISPRAMSRMFPRSTTSSNCVKPSRNP